MPIIELDFYGLSRPVQERFIASAQAQAVPAPLAVKRATPTDVRPWLIGGVAAVTLLVVLASLGFGKLSSPMALASPLQLVLYVALLGTAAACLLRALALRERFMSLPYPPGNYLFPIGVVEARSATVRLHSLIDLDTTQAANNVLRLVFAGGQSFEFSTRSETESTQVRQQVLEAKRTLTLAEETHNRRELARLDPLRDNGFSNPFGPSAAFRQRNPPWARAWLPLALVVGVVGGFGLWKMRNALGESRLYAAAAARNDAESYRAYLARGGNRAAVKDILLPRAELKGAAALGTVEAIERYIDSHPSSAIADEVAVAQRSALLSELERAKQQETLSAIRELKARYKNVAPVAKEIAAAEHEFYQRVFEQYRTLAPQATEKSDPVAFFRRLFNYLESHGPKVEVRWRRQLRESVRRADVQVKLSAYFMGQQSIPSQYFDAEHCRKREAAASEKLIAGLQAHFPVEVLRWEVGAPFDEPDLKASDSDAPLPSPSLPTLFITHNVEMTGGYMNANPRGIFVGAGILFDAVLQIPGDPEPLLIKFSVWRPPDLKLLKQEGMTTEGIYEDMVSTAFFSFADRYVSSIVKKK